jgi:aminomethyltransferase
MSLQLLRTPFHDRTAGLAQGAAWRRWAGHAVLGSYELHHDREYAAIRNGVGLLDVSPLYKYLIHGSDAARLLDRVLPRHVAASRVGQVLYMPWCDGHGKVIDDGTCTRLAENRFRLTSADPSIRWLQRNAVGMDVVVEDVSRSLAALALQGPRSRELLMRLADADVEGLRYFRAVEGSLRGVPVWISRTGYTGDLGYEVWLASADALTVWDALIEEGAGYGLLPAGILALDVARIEAGLIMIDVDYVSAHRAVVPSQLSTPYELGLGWAVKLDKGPFNGREALAAEKARGPAWQLVGIEVDWDALVALFGQAGLPPQLPSVAWRTSIPVFVGGSQVGYATSGCWSPILKKSVALAHLPARYAAPGTGVELEVTVEHFRRRAAATVVPTPFFDPERKKAVPS